MAWSELFRTSRLSVLNCWKKINSSPNSIINEIPLKIINIFYLKNYFKNTEFIPELVLYQVWKVTPWEHKLSTRIDKQFNSLLQKAMCWIKIYLMQSRAFHIGLPISNQREKEICINTHSLKFWKYCWKLSATSCNP